MYVYCCYNTCMHVCICCTPAVSATWLLMERHLSLISHWGSAVQTVNSKIIVRVPGLPSCSVFSLWGLWSRGLKPVDITELLAVWIWTGLLSSVWHYPERALHNTSSFTYETASFITSVMNLLSSLLKVSNGGLVYRDFSPVFHKIRCHSPSVSCALKTTPILGNFYYDINISFKHMAFSFQTQHRRYTPHFMIDDSKFNFFCTFCIISLHARHKK